MKGIKEMKTFKTITLGILGVLSLVACGNAEPNILTLTQTEKAAITSFVLAKHQMNLAFPEDINLNTTTLIECKEGSYTEDINLSSSSFSSFHRIEFDNCLIEDEDQNEIFTVNNYEDSVFNIFKSSVRGTLELLNATEGSGVCFVDVKFDEETLEYSGQICGSDFVL